MAVPTHAQGLNAVYSPDGTDVWAVGDNGYYIRSFTSGNSWMTGTLGAVPLRGVAARGFTAVIVGDGGSVWRSVNSGGAWSPQTLPGAPALRALEWPSDSTLFVAGAGGRIARSRDSGTSWTTLPSGTATTLNSIRFRDALHGWAVGDGGTALRTDDGGDSWQPVAVPVASRLLAVDALGAFVWIVGANNVALKSLDSGDHWTRVDLNVDVEISVNAVRIESPSRVILAGGGGFIRETPDSGATWTWMQHPLLTGVTTLFFAGDHLNAWACGHASKAIEATHDGGATWALTPGTAPVNTGWLRTLVYTQTASSQVRGSSIAINAQAPGVLFATMGPGLYRSPDLGATWTSLGNVSSGTYTPEKTNAFYISPRDSNLMVIAAAKGGGSGGFDKILRSTNRGATWDVTLDNQSFSEYGVPLEMNVDHPDTLLFAPEDGHLYRSLDFGATWDTLSTPGFRSPCDIQIVPGDNANVWVGDGVTGIGQGEIWQSLDGGLTFHLRFPQPEDTLTNGSEVPMMVCPRLDPKLGFASHWPSGGMSITNDAGATWTELTNTPSAWGTDIAHDDPTVGSFAVFSGSTGFLTTNRGVDFSAYTLGGSNYSVFAYDRGNILTQQSNGIYRFTAGYTSPVSNSQFLTLDAPFAGQVLPANQIRQIQWSATGVAVVRVEYRAHATDPWTLLADVPGYYGSYDWTVPDSATTTARVRIRDPWDDSPADSSGNFTIASPRIAVAPVAIDFGTRGIGSVTVDTVRVTNTGTGTLHVGPVASNSAAFTPGRMAFTLAPGQSDTLGVAFRPIFVGGYGDTLVITSDASGRPVSFTVVGTAIDTLRLALTAPDGGEMWPAGSTQQIRWESAVVSKIAIDWQSVPGGWANVADNVPTDQGSFAFDVPLVPTSQARIRIRDIHAQVQDSSSAPFTITVPLFATSAIPLDFGPVTIGTWRYDTLRVANLGNAPLVITDIGTNSGALRPARTALTLAPGQSDSVGFVYAPSALAHDTATVTFVSNAPGTPQRAALVGDGVIAGPTPGIPQSFGFAQNTPNPFSTRTLIRYSIPTATHVLVEVFNLQGQRVATLVNATQAAGNYAVVFGVDLGEARALPTGVYFCRLRAGSFEGTRKLLLTR